MYSHNAQMKWGANPETLPRIMARPAISGGTLASVRRHACLDELARSFVAQPSSAGRLPRHSGGPLCHTGHPIKSALTKH